ncbi:phage tail protein [Brucella intermedia]|uniref:phage tail protein n=1 Tax=Brucella intermedia TaxID=94625 RepID=UPI00224ACB14|nr:phage tail protein [Brucella intermedia]
MAYPTLVLPKDVGVDVGSSISSKPRVRRAQFGDGYSQRSGDGLNANGVKFEATFSVLLDSEARQILNFFEERKGYLPFWWTVPGEITPRQWIATEWRKSFTGPTTRGISAMLEETFDP